MRQLADVRPLVGRTFTASSGNVCTVSMLGAGGVGVAWRPGHTPQDVAEFAAWAESIIGPTRTVTFDAGKLSEGAEAKERAAYALFLRGEGERP